MKRLLLILTVLTAVLGFSIAAHALEIDGGSFPVNANVVPTCTIEAVGIDFGDYGGLVVEANGSVNVTCIVELEYQVALDIGLNGTLGRQMSDGGSNLLNYEIYQDDTVSVIWGDSCVDSATYPSEDCTPTLVGTGSPIIIPTWGQIFPNQLVPEGPYSDTVGVTIVF